MFLENRPVIVKQKEEEIKATFVGFGIGCDTEFSVHTHKTVAILLLEDGTLTYTDIHNIKFV